MDVTIEGHFLGAPRLFPWCFQAFGAPRPAGKSLVAPKAHFQLAAELSRSRDFACPLTMFVGLSVGLSVGYL